MLHGPARPSGLGPLKTSTSPRARARPAGESMVPPGAPPGMRQPRERHGRQGPTGTQYARGTRLCSCLYRMPRPPGAGCGTRERRVKNNKKRALSQTKSKAYQRNTNKETIIITFCEPTKTPSDRLAYSTDFLAALSLSISARAHTHGFPNPLHTHANRSPFFLALPLSLASSLLESSGATIHQSDGPFFRRGAGARGP